MPKTRADLIRAALEELLIAQAGQPISAEDNAQASSRVDPMLAQLQASSVVYVANPDEIDDAVFLPLARILANELGPSYGRVRDPGVMLMAERELARVIVPPSEDDPVYAEYF